MPDITNFERALILAPHTDDAELGCGGTMAKMLEQDMEIFVAAFSTARASLPPGSNPDLLKEEFLTAMETFQIPEENLFIYDYKVRKLNYFRQEVLEELVKLKEDLKPDIVLLPSGSDLHQDHQVVYNEGLRAFKDSTVWGDELPWNHITFSAQAFITLSKQQLDTKWEALKAYESQIEKGRNYFTRDFIEGLAKVRGVQVKAEYAEAYEVVRLKW